MTKILIFIKVKQLDNYRCRIWGCGRNNNIEVHHIIPKSAGGKDTEGNLITLCFNCHKKITEGKLTNTKLLISLKYKKDFRWKKALQWHLDREQLKNEKLKNIKSRSTRTN